MRKLFGTNSKIFSRKKRGMAPDFAWVTGTVLSMLLTVFLLLSLSDRVEACSNQWTSLGPEGAYVMALAIDPVEPNTIYAGTLWGGVLKTTDWGNNWVAINNGLPTINYLHVYSLTIDPHTPNTIYAGTWEGVFKTIDGGSNWAAMSNGITDVNIRALAIDPDTPDIVYAGGIGRYSGKYGGVFKSADGGNNWTAITNGLSLFYACYVYALAIDADTPSIIYAGTRGYGVFDYETLTPEQELENIILQIQDLVSLGELSEKDSKALITRCEVAIQLFNKGKTNAALNGLKAFINQVNAMINSRKLLQGEGDALFKAASNVSACN